jgi:multidrug transporter EmrE-like cation transporter
MQQQQRSEVKMDSLLQAAARIMRPGIVQHEALLFVGTVILAALFFTVGGIFMKLSEGLTKFWPTMIVFALFVTGAALQTLAMKREDLAVTYLMVVGLEAILAFLFGVLVFSEACSLARIAGVLLITFGIISLRSAF